MEAIQWSCTHWEALTSLSYSFHKHNLPVCAGGMKGASGFSFPV